jgi:predicted ester cyclase
MTDNNPDYPSLALITQYVSALRERDESTMQSLRSPEFVLDWVHSDAFANNPLTLEVANQFWSVWFSAFSEMDYEITRTIAAENVIITQWVFTGTQTGPLGVPVFDTPIDPTGKTICLRGISVYDIQGKLIDKETMYIDLATLWVELGVTL